MDDALIGSNTLQTVVAAYEEEHADVTVGTMLRTDKKQPPGTLRISFEDPRRTRGGGNVWSHLRTFRKYLLDGVDEADLKDEHGQFYDVAQDWAFMIPIVERALAPLCIRKVAYLYEPSEAHYPKDYQEQREKAIDHIVSKPAYSKPRFTVAVVGYANVTRAGSKELAERCVSSAEQVGRLLADAGYIVATGGMGGVMEAACKGAKSSTNAFFGGTVGILPGHHREQANAFVDIAVPSGLDLAHSSVLVNMADAIIAVGGGAGEKLI
jgi:hypothetical protein